MGVNPRSVLLGSALLCLCLVGTVQAQRSSITIPDLKNSSHVGVGYTAHIPTNFLGFSALYVTPKLLGGFGVYIDARFETRSLTDDPGYLPGVTVQEAEVTNADFLFEQSSEWSTVDVGLVYAVSQELAVYGGAGYTRERHYREYWDASETLGNLGFYLVDDPAASGNRVNVIGGALIRLTRYTLFQLGLGSKPPGATVGVMLVLPH
ncbi:MAG TPA: hypothetical protein VGA22_14360 [Gemmatimonadales bacterium]